MGKKDFLMAFGMTAFSALIMFLFYLYMVHFHVKNMFEVVS